MRSNEDAAKDPSQLEREVEQQRREITNTIQQLEDRFSSREIYNQAAAYVRGHGGEFAENLGNSVKSNPLPVVLTSIGLLWMMVGQRSPSTAYEYQTRESGMGKMQGKASELKEKVSSAMERVSPFKREASDSSQDIRSKAASTGQHFRDSTRQARKGFSRSMSSTRSNFEHYLQEQPLALGALGIALGAIVGASLPRSQMENRALGDVSERDRSKVSEMAEKGYEKASEMGESVHREAQQSFNPERQPEHQPSPAGPTGQGSRPTP